MKPMLRQLTLAFVLLAVICAPMQVLAASPAPAASAGQIAIMTSPGGDIVLLDTATGKTQRLTAGMDPAFSPDSSKLAFTRWGTEPGLFVRCLLYTSDAADE